MLATRMRQKKELRRPLVTWINSGISTTDASSYNFGNFTAASSGLMVVATAATGVSGGSRTLTSISIGGSSGNVVVDHAGASLAVPTCIVAREVSAGNNNVTVTWSNSMARCTVGVWLITDYHSAAARDVDYSYNSSGAATTISATLDYHSYGVGIYVVRYGTGGGGFSWSAASERYDVSPESTGRDAYADKQLSSVTLADVETATGDSVANRSMAAAVWR